MFMIGLTGGIGSGKSTVAHLFMKQGITIIDTDLIARELAQPYGKAYQNIVMHFGKKILKDDNTIDRPKLRQIIFADLKEKKWLEHLLHPLIRVEAFTQMQAVRSPYGIVVIPLLAENYPFPHLNRILVIDTSEDKQIERLVNRDNLSILMANQILKQQATRDARLAIAHDVIHNNRDLKHLEREVLKMHEFYLGLVEI